MAAKRSALPRATTVLPKPILATSRAVSLSARAIAGTVPSLSSPEPTFLAAATTLPESTPSAPQPSLSGSASACAAPRARAPTPPVPQGGAIPDAKPSASPPLLADPVLGLLASQHTDLEKVRIALGNRIGQLTRTGADKDGEERGFGIPEDSPIIRSLRQSLDLAGAAEHGVELVMRRRLRKHPLFPWMREVNGLGEKTMARLLGCIGDPYWNGLHGRPRTVSEFWAYCGLHVVRAGDAQSRTDIHGTPGIAPRRRRGQKANWNGEAKMRLFLLAEACLKQTGEPDKNGKPTPLSPYRAVYDSARAKHAETLHRAPCERCGPAGKPAAVGSALSDAHKHARAMRAVMKAIAKDLWCEAKRLHEASAALESGESLEMGP